MTNNHTPCAICGINPRLGALLCCKPCLKTAADADRKTAKAFLDVKLGNEDLVIGAREASPREVIGEAMRRLAELRNRQDDPAEQKHGA